MTALLGWTLAAMPRGPACISKLPWDERLNFERTEEGLLHGEIKSIVTIQEHLKEIGRPYTGEAEAYYVELENELAGVFKPDEDPEFPWSSVAEVSMYQLSQKLQTKLVLPTVLRRIRGKKGSFQYYLKDTFDLVDSPDEKKLALAKLTPKRKADMAVLLFIAGQWDRHWGNLLIDRFGGLALIDNEGILILQMIRYGDHPFVCRGFKREAQGSAPSTDFPFDSPHQLKDPTLEVIKEAFGSYLDQRKLENIHSKVGSFVDETLSYVIWNQALWFHLTKKGRSAIYTDTYSRQTMDNLAKFTALEWSELFPKPFGGYHQRLFFNRVRQIQMASQKNGLWIP